MTKVTKGWPPARRKRQAELIRRTKPWLKTTGPRTRQGKDAVRHNACKHGFYDENWRRFRQVLLAQRRFLKEARRLLTKKRQVKRPGCGAPPTLRKKARSAARPGIDYLFNKRVLKIPVKPCRRPIYKAPAALLLPAAFRYPFYAGG